MLHLVEFYWYLLDHLQEEWDEWKYGDEEEEEDDDDE